MQCKDKQAGFLIRIFSALNWLKSYIPNAPQATMMGQSHSISIEGLNNVALKWSNRYSKVSHLVFVPIGPIVRHSGLSITL